MPNKPYGIPDSGGQTKYKLVNVGHLQNKDVHAYFTPGQQLGGAFPIVPDSLQGAYKASQTWPVLNKLARIPRVVLLTSTASGGTNADSVAWGNVATDLDNQLQAIDANTYCIRSADGGRNVARMIPQLADIANGQFVGVDLLVLSICNCNDGDAAVGGYWADGTIIPHGGGRDFPTATYNTDKANLASAISRLANFAVWFYFDSSQPTGTSNFTYNTLKPFGANLGNEVPNLAGSQVNALQKANVAFGSASAATFLSDIRNYWGI